MSQQSSSGEQISVNGADVLQVVIDQNSELLLKFAHSEARRLYLEKRVAALQSLVDEQQSAQR